MGDLYQEEKPHHKSVCWNCHSDIDDSHQPRCSHCHWVACPVCGACRGGRFPTCDRCFTHPTIRDLKTSSQLQLNLTQ